MRNISRREALEFIIAGAMATFAVGYTELGFCQEEGNFRAIYLNPKLRAEFFSFLQNVYHLYPEQKFDELISAKVKKFGTDREIYEAILAEIPTIKPKLAEIRYALPSLRKQKEIMCEQTLVLLDGKKIINGYLEIGTTGRYFDRLRDSVRIGQTPIFVHTSAPTFGAADIMERGQIRKVGKFVPLNDYAPIRKEDVEDESLDLLTVYIGYHHSPPERRLEFIRSCYRVLRKSGMLIVRDHDVDSGEMVHFVALAHDVFNAGLELPWDTNAVEIRNFISLGELERILLAEGFQKDERRLLQKGDPTRNTLMKFIKV